MDTQPQSLTNRERLERHLHYYVCAAQLSIFADESWAPEPCLHVADFYLDLYMQQLDRL